MTWKHYLGITVLSMLVMIGITSFQSAPGYMDAEYYFGMGLRIATNEGLSEPFMWNYLAGVESIPRPGFSYWMPMPAFLSALGIWISGLKTFAGGKIIHVLLAGLVPATAMIVTWRKTGNSSIATLAGLLAVFPVFYPVFLGTTDSFAVVMILGGAFLLLTGEKGHPGKFLGLGVIAGLMHLSRADGLIWILAGLYCAARAPKNRGISILSVIGGYLLCMAPWFGRNLIATGQIMPTGLSGAFWLREYDDLFIYSPTGLTYQQWISQGLKAIFRTYLKAGISNLNTALFVQGQIMLAPFVFFGAWKHRRDIGFQAAFIAWLCIFLIMSFVFPFAGLRGGYFHSSAAFQTLIWCLAASGFYKVIDWGVEKRDWTRAKAGMVFGAVLVVMITVASSYVFSSRVIGGDIKHPIWNESYHKTKRLAEYLENLGLEENDLIMINNPPGFYIASGLPSIVIPSGGIDDLLKAGEDFGADYVVLEINHPQGLNDLYKYPEIDSRLTYLGSYHDAFIFQLPEQD